MIRKGLLAFVAWYLAASMALACAGQGGKVIFEDNFTDDSGGWEADNPKFMEIKDGAMAIHPNPSGAKADEGSYYSINQTFNASEGDYCVEFILPKDPAADSPVSAGMEFLRKNSDNYYLLQIKSDKSLLLFKKTAGSFSIVVKATDFPLKTDPDSVNTMRVLVKQGKISLFVNDQQIKVIRTQIPDGDLFFGLYAEVAKPSDLNPAVKFKNIKVTAGQ